MPPTADEQIRFLVNLQRLLDEGLFDATMTFPRGRHFRQCCQFRSLLWAGGATTILAHCLVLSGRA